MRREQGRFVRLFGGAGFGGDPVGFGVPQPPLDARTCPLVLAGGKNLGLKHGRFIKQQAERPLVDLFLTRLHRFDIPAKSFADNAGEFREILAS